MCTALNSCFQHKLHCIAKRIGKPLPRALRWGLMSGLDELDWPVQNPDLNPTEHLLGIRVEVFLSNFSA